MGGASRPGPLAITVQSGAVASAMDAVANVVGGIAQSGGTYIINNLAPVASVATAAEALKVGDELTVDIVVKGDSLASAEGTFSFDARAIQVCAHTVSFDEAA